jgi:hypothetical protein
MVRRSSKQAALYISDRIFGLGIVDFRPARGPKTPLRGLVTGLGT